MQHPSPYRRLEWKFSTLKEVREYLSGDRITCLICGRQMRRLQYMHLRKHGLDADGYRERFGIPWTYSLTSASSRKASSDSIGPKQLAALKHDKPRGGRPGQKLRDQCPANAELWVKNAEMGREASARRRVTVPCSNGCGAEMMTTALTAAKPIFCDACASPAALRLRRLYVRRYAGAENSLRAA
jgi:hypothetical protein